MVLHGTSAASWATASSYAVLFASQPRQPWTPWQMARCWTNMASRLSSAAAACRRATPAAISWRSCWAPSSASWSSRYVRPRLLHPAVHAVQGPHHVCSATHACHSSLQLLCTCAVMCLAWLGRRWWRDRKRMMMDEGPQGPTDWEIDMGDIKCAVLCLCCALLQLSCQFLPHDVLQGTATHLTDVCSPVSATHTPPCSDTSATLPLCRLTRHDVPPAES